MGRWVCITVAMLCCLLAVATSASAQPAECERIRGVRRQAEDQLMALLASPIQLTTAEMAAAALNQYDPWPAARARRQFDVQRYQQLIGQLKQREQEVCAAAAPATPSPSERRPQPSEGGPSVTPQAPPQKDRPACAFGAYWNSERGRCVKIGDE